MTTATSNLVIFNVSHSLVVVIVVVCKIFFDYISMKYFHGFDS